MDRIYADAYRLKKLGTLIESGIFAVPELQREFVWSARKACDLLDSIYCNYPIGTILVWKTNRRNEGELRKQLHILPHFNPANHDIYFLIDGQQRLSVLWHFLRGEAASVTNSQGQELHFGSVYFDPYAAEGDRMFVYRTRLMGDLAKRLVAVVDVLSGGWRRRMRNHGVRALRRLEECRRRFLNYQVYFVFCETNELSEVRETFVRINSLGMRIGAADRAFARASRFNMRGLVREAQARLRNGFDHISRETILQTAALALGARDVGERAIDSMISRLLRDDKERIRFGRLWPVLREAFGVAADFMVHELGVANFDFLPSEPMLGTLALFFFHNRNARPSRAAKRRLEKWFWATAVGARYTGRGFRPNVLADAAFAERLAANPQAQVRVRVAVPGYMLFNTEYGRPGPLSNAFFCLLRLHRPRYLEDGAEIPLGEISSRRNRRDKHHIFPRALLNRNGIGPERINSVLNICFLVARENQSVGQRAPRHYFADLPRSNRARSLALQSHLIPDVDGEGVWDRSLKRGFKAFLEGRARRVSQAFERRAGMRLFERR
jgi:hypothetical protein